MAFLTARGFSADELFKGSAYLAEVLLDPKKSTSEDPKDAPMMVCRSCLCYGTLHSSRRRVQLAFKSSKPSWEWYEEPGNEYRLKRFAAAMEGTSRADPPNAIHLGKPPCEGRCLY